MASISIILEGCDKTGKSTLANELMLEFPDVFKTIMRFKAPGGNTRQEQYWNARNEYEVGIVYAQRSGIIFDRFLLGEAVYAPLMRGYYPYYIRNLEKKIPPTTLLVVLTAPESLVARRFDTDNETFIKKEDIGYLLNAYNEEFKLSNIQSKVMINSQEEDPFEYVAKIVRGMKQ